MAKLFRSIYRILCPLFVEAGKDASWQLRLSSLIGVELVLQCAAEMAGWISSRCRLSFGALLIASAARNVGFAI
jgi:hypothetical protein